MQTAPSREPAASRTDTAVIARGVAKHYGATVAVTDLDLAIPAGTIYGFIGPSGSGKTTTIRLLTGIERPTEGLVEVLGQPPSAFDPADRARLGYLPQLSVLFPALSLWDNLSFVASIYGLPLRRRERLQEVLEFVELDEDRRKRLRDASGGMQRRLALAAALVHQPELLFLDEPTAGIDPVLRRKFWDRFAELRTAGRTLFVTTQYVSDADHCDQVGILSEGRLVAEGTPDELRRQAHGGDVLEIDPREPVAQSTIDELLTLPSVTSCARVEGTSAQLRAIVTAADEAIPRIADWFDDRGVIIEAIRKEQPSFDDVFVALLRQSEA